MTTDEEYNAVLPFKTPIAVAMDTFDPYLTPRQNMTAAIEAYRQQIRDFIETREHPDDWGVPCIYTKNLREALDMGPSPL